MSAPCVSRGRALGGAREALAADLAALACAVADAADDAEYSARAPGTAAVVAAADGAQDAIVAALALCSPSRARGDHESAQLWTVAGAALSLGGALADLASNRSPGWERIHGAREHGRELARLGARFLRRASLWEALECADLAGALSEGGAR